MKTKFDNPLLNKTKFTLFLATLFTCFAMFFSCSDSDNPTLQGDTVKMADMAGTWNATSATFNGTDVIAEGGSVSMVIQTNGRFNFTIKRQGMNDMVFTGQLGFDEEWLAVEYDTNPGEWEYYDFDLTNGNTKLHIGANSEFDFDNDGADEFVVFFLDMVKT